MDNLFEGMLQYEIILSILGVILFLVLLLLLIYMIIKERKFNSILGFFVIPILMIGFPGIKKIQFNDWVIELREELAQTTDAPVTEKQDQIGKILSKINPDRFSSYNNSLLLAEAYAYVGDTLEAYRSTEKALAAEPSSQQATELKNKLSENPLVKVDMKIREVQQNPSDQNLKRELNQSLQEIEPSTSNERPVDYVLMARAKKALGEEEEAKKYIDSALVIDPDYGIAKKLNRSLNRGKH